MTRYISADDYMRTFCIGMTITPDVRLQIETTLDLAAGHIDGARASVGAAGCAVSTAVADQLKMVNAIFAAVVWSCPCSRALTEEAKDRLLPYAQSVVEAIVSGVLEVCEGETGINFPAIALPQIAWNDAIAAEIYNNYLAG